MALKEAHRRLIGWLAILAYILVFYWMGHINYHIKRADLTLLIMAVMSFVTVFAILKTSGRERPGQEG